MNLTPAPFQKWRKRPRMLFEILLRNGRLICRNFRFDLIDLYFTTSIRTLDVTFRPQGAHFALHWSRSIPKICRKVAAKNGRPPSSKMNVCSLLFSKLVEAELHDLHADSIEDANDADRL